MLSKYMKPRAIRREARTVAGRFRGGKLAPVMAQPFLGSESGSVQQSITYELDPIAGRMITEVTAEVISVFVPLLAVEALKNPDHDYPGNAEIFREKMMRRDVVFGFEAESEISRRLGIVPRSINGQKKVCKVSRIAHNAAVNFLRQRKYVKAKLLEKDNNEVTPALIGQTVLDRLNGVLDPEDRINGAVNFDIPKVTLPVKGIGTTYPLGSTSIADVRETKGVKDYNNYLAGANMVFRLDKDNANGGKPQIVVDYDGASNDISLKDFYTAERMDQLTREMRRLVDENPQYGEEIVARFAHGLSVDTGKQPFVVYENRKAFSMGLTRAMDGPNLDVTQTNLVARHEFTVPIPPSEFGGILITFASVKPDETLGSQPHPILSDVWQARNFIADELAIDPQPVQVRDLYADCKPEKEERRVLYVGNNHLLKTYVNYGFSRELDPSTVEAKTAIWQLEVPLSVTPDSVLYPEKLEHYPFADQKAEVCTYTVTNNSQINTPIIFGPTPVEELEAIETEDVFDDAEE